MRIKTGLILGMMAAFGVANAARAQEPPACAQELMAKLTDVMQALDPNKVPESDMKKYSMLFNEALAAGQNGHMDEVCDKLQDTLDYAKTLHEE